MAATLVVRRIFLSSASGLESTRALVRSVVSGFNALHSARYGCTFIVVGFEDLPRGLGRPQEKINPYVAGCDFLLLLLADHLGSPTTPSPPFQTGVEEELAIAVTSCAATDSPMVDMLLLFRTPDEAALVAPSPELQQVQNFRHAIEATKEVTYQSYRTDEEVRRAIDLQLVEWSGLEMEKEPAEYPRLLAALDRSATYEMTSLASSDPDELAAWAQTQADAGLVTSADAAFAKAVTTGGPSHLLAYARFLQRTGQLDRAYELDERVLARDDVVGRDDPMAVGYRTAALANMGLVKRKLGDLPASRRYLFEAVSTARPHGTPVAEPLAYALDQLGLTLARLGALDPAADAYREALDLREAAHDELGSAQSHINLARIERDRGQPEEAEALLVRAVDLLEPSGETRALANALASRAMLKIDSDASEARVLLQRALSINEQLQLPDGISVCSNGLAALELSQGDPDAARPHADRVLEVSRASGNSEGVAVAYRLLGQVHCAREDWEKALEFLDQAVAASEAQGDPVRQASARLWRARALAGADRIRDATAEAERALAVVGTDSDLAIAREIRGVLDQLHD